MPNKRDFAVETTGSKVTGTLMDKLPVNPNTPPTGLTAIGPRVTFHFITEPWSADNEYQYYDVVNVNDNSYIAIKNVPSGTQITNTEYWFHWADPNAQYQELLNTVQTFDGRITENTKNIETKAPIAHASEDDTYGIGSENMYGHVKLATDDTSIANDEKSGIAATPSMVHALIKKNKEFLTPEMFGAVGDGTNDDTAALNSMFQAASGKTCILSKVYAVYGPLAVPNRVNIAGFSNYSIQQSAIVAKGTWTPNESLMTIGSHCGFFNVFIGGIQEPEVNMTGITYDGLSDDADITMFDCCIYYFNRGMNITGRNYRFVNTMFSSCNYVCLIANSKNIELRDYEFINCRFHSNSIVCNTEGVTNYASNTLSINFLDCEFEYSAIIYRGIGDGLVFDGCKMVGKVNTVLTSDTTPIIITHIVNPNRGVAIRNCDIDFYRESYNRDVKYLIISLSSDVPYVVVSNSTIKDFSNNVVATQSPGKVQTLVLNGNVLKKADTSTNTDIQKLNNSFTRAIVTGNYVDSAATEANLFPITDDVNAIRANNLTNTPA